MLALNSLKWATLNICCSQRIEDVPSWILTLQNTEDDKVFLDTLSVLDSAISHQTSICVLSLAVIPYLVELLEQKPKHSMKILPTIWAVVTFEDKKVIDEADNEILNYYYESIIKIRDILPMFIEDNIKKIHPYDKSIVALVYLRTVGAISDAKVIGQIGPEFNECEVDCPHCGEYELVDLTKKNKNLIHKNFEVNEQVTYNDDIQIWLYTLLSKIKEKYLSNALPLIYGNYICKACKKEYNLLERLKDFD